jgi:uncharacterized protein
LIKTGDFNKLRIARKTNFGYFLDANTGSSSEDILLPNKNTPDIELNIGDEVTVFIYPDSKDRLTATMKAPYAKVGDIARLKVVATTNIGTFVDVGLEKDVLVPMKEKLYPLETNNYYLFYVYLDKTGRIAATTNVDKYLEIAEDYKIGDSIKGTVYGFQTNNSAMIAVENKYIGVILHNEYFTELHQGDELDLNVKKIYEDGKLGLTPRSVAKVERETLQETILEYLKTHDNFMPFNDKSSPEDIHEAFHASKNYFKQSLGGLMRKGLITQDEKGTRLK